MDCQAGFVGTTYYVVCDKDMDGVALESGWEDANSTCISKGYDGLAKLVNSDEDTRVVGLASKPGLPWGEVWIGLSDPEDDGVWTWMDGSTAAYQNWGGGAPSPAEENCVELYATSDWTWHDRGCSDALAFVCESREEAQDTFEGTPDPGSF
jgi:hypothetical protein